MLFVLIAIYFLPQETITAEDHNLLTMLLLTQTIIFNKKRKWEIQQLTVDDLASGPNGDDNLGFTVAEKLLAKRYVCMMPSLTLMAICSTLAIERYLLI